MQCDNTVVAIPSCKGTTLNGRQKEGIKPKQQNPFSWLLNLAVTLGSCSRNLNEERTSVWLLSGEKQILRCSRNANTQQITLVSSISLDSRLLFVPLGMSPGLCFAVELHGLGNNFLPN